MKKQFDDNGITELSIDELENYSEQIYGGWGAEILVPIGISAGGLLVSIAGFCLQYRASHSATQISFTQSTRNWIANFRQPSVQAMMSAASSVASSVSSQASTLFFDAQQSGSLNEAVDNAAQAAEVYVNAV